MTDARPHGDCDRRITELEAEVATLRTVVRYADYEIHNEWGESMANRIGFDLDDECEAAVRRALEENG